MEPISLKAVVEQLYLADDESPVYFDKQASGFVYIDFSESPDEAEEAAEMISSNPSRFVRLPDRYDIHEYSIMQDFIATLPDGTARDGLTIAIQGSGAFRRFRDTLRYFGIQQQWYDYRDEAFRQMAVEWCEENGIAYEE